MSTNAKEARYRDQMAKLAKHKEELRKAPGEQNPHRIMEPRELIKIRNRCKICGRSNAVYRKFGICRIHFRELASDGLIPGVRKASW